MQSNRQIPTTSAEQSGRFARRLGLFYGAVFVLSGTHLPFFPVWLRAIGLDPSWIGAIIAVPAVTRFTVLPVIIGLAERRHALRGAMMVSASAAALGFALLGTQHLPLSVFLIYVVICCLWTPLVPLTDAYALRGVQRYGLNYGRLRLWGSAAFIVGTLFCGILVDIVPPARLIWIIVAGGILGAAASFFLQPIGQAPRAKGTAQDGRRLLRDGSFVCIILAAALVQGSHAAFYAFSAIDWRSRGLDGVTVGGLWAIGVVAEIIVFALSPRITLAPTMLVAIGAAVAVLRWVTMALEPPLAVLAIVQVGHGFSFGLTQVGTMALLVRHVPAQMTARGQGYYAAASGIIGSVTSMLSGPIYARYGQGIYDVMAVMALLGGVLMWLVHARSTRHPHKAASGG